MGKAEKTIANLGKLCYSESWKVRNCGVGGGPLLSFAILRRTAEPPEAVSPETVRKSGTPDRPNREGNRMKKITELTAELVGPAIAEQGCTLWDVEYVKEGGTWYLRVLLDKEGGVDILDCEAISRKLSDLLDEADPIEGSYTLEVGSAGAERALKRPGDFARFMDSPVLVKLYRPVDGRKEYPGVLTGYDEADGAVTVRLGKDERTFPKKDVALVRLRVEF